MRYTGVDRAGRFVFGAPSVLKPSAVYEGLAAAPAHQVHLGPWSLESTQNHRCTTTKDLLPFFYVRRWTFTLLLGLPTGGVWVVLLSATTRTKNEASFVYFDEPLTLLTSREPWAITAEAAWAITAEAAWAITAEAAWACSSEDPLAAPLIWPAPHSALKRCSLCQPLPLLVCS
jgi:hypothetical protein